MSAAPRSVLDGLGLLHAQLSEPVVADEGVVRDDAHPEPERASRDLLADAAEADHAERLSGELHPTPP